MILPSLYFEFFLLFYSLPIIIVVGPLWFIGGDPFPSSGCQVVSLINNNKHICIISRVAEKESDLVPKSLED